MKRLEKYIERPKSVITGSALEEIHNLKIHSEFWRQENSHLKNKLQMYQKLIKAEKFDSFTEEDTGNDHSER